MFVFIKHFGFFKNSFVYLTFTKMMDMSTSAEKSFTDKIFEKVNSVKKLDFSYILDCIEFTPSTLKKQSITLFTDGLYGLWV